MRRHQLQRQIRAAILVSASVAFLHAQGRGGGEWTTSGFDAQRSSWLRGDARLTKDAVQKGEFAYLWSMKIENRQLNSLTPPVLRQPSPPRGAGPPGGREGRGAPAAPGRGRGPAPIGFGRVDPLFVVGSDGFIHSLYVSNGAETEPPVPFLPPDTKPSALIWVDGIVYTTTSGECGAAPNALWAMDLNVPVEERKSVSWKTGSANIAGASGVAFGTDGTIYLALGTSTTAA